MRTKIMKFARKCPLRSVWFATWDFDLSAWLSSICCCEYTCVSLCYQLWRHTSLLHRVPTGLTWSRSKAALVLTVVVWETFPLVCGLASTMFTLAV